MTVKIGIVGSRKRNNPEDLIRVQSEVNKLRSILPDYNDIHIVSGGCTEGADRFAEVIAKYEQFPITIHYAKWSLQGHSAGPIRNTKIAEESDFLISCVSQDRTGGTEDTIRKFLNKEDNTKLILC